MQFVTGPSASGSSKVFGVGWAKTGTTTLGECLRSLGYNHYGRNLSLVPDIARGQLDRVMLLAAAHESFSDWPWTRLFRELDQAFPGSRFVLTTRDPDRWLSSYLAMLSGEGEPTEYLAGIRSFLYGLDVRVATTGQLQDRLCRHQADVFNYFRDRPDALLVVDWEAGDGWPELCGFLGKPCPSVPFPHLNRRPGQSSRP